MWPCESLPAGGGFVTAEAGTQILCNAGVRDEGYSSLESNSGGGYMDNVNVDAQGAAEKFEDKDDNAVTEQLAGRLLMDGEQEDMERKQGGHACLEDEKQKADDTALHAEVSCGALGQSEVHNESTEQRAPENNAVRKRVRWVDEKRLGPLAAAEDGSPYTERGLGLTAGGQRWTKKRVRRLSVEGVRGSRYKHRLKGRRGTIGFGREEEVESGARLGTAHRKWGSWKANGDEETGDSLGRAHGTDLHKPTRFGEEAKLDADALLERQAIVESVRQLRARISQPVGESAAKMGEELLGGWGIGSPQGRRMLREGLEVPKQRGNHGLEVSTELGKNEGRNGMEVAERHSIGGEPGTARDELLKAQSPAAKLWTWPGENVWRSTYHDMGSGFGAIQLNPRGAEVDRSGLAGRDGDIGQEEDGKRALESEVEGGRHRASGDGEPAQTSSKTEGAPSNGYNGRGVPAFQWLKVPKVSGGRGPCKAAGRRVLHVATKVSPFRAAIPVLDVYLAKPLESGTGWEDWRYSQLAF
ncbi:hypothetical protein KFL_005000070 [Klebsormidium nitens]|uniref:Uncharacterized protein n=1 Tax=Klebsormidium nitens TaxID=105231 RepID=A0A1Y1IE75_KLENI|nr:hypothetical protein KFL_005000070 [Klebsormidium nitens]|eukprot:GAQ89230.1 hypothetical protein KFL_005000070 [Klebsormidium nitens]